ncbi:MAG: hypothetical protein B5766_01445 [Candidatus Lumbricidophila eiseniae]|uniref:Phage holin family protein n=1 Tax=Candidatus Lumbricidiphila eiseniae TaxID=1969409 RepID=A0A2A6FU64_9MICO|nr:MAG: hypothetical protein B5766_01445 [Candidatus Lumbricidophila eiseniae]
MVTSQPSDERSLLTILGQLPDTIHNLIRAEIAQIRTELSYKAKNFGIGSGMFAAAAFVAIFLLGTLIAAAILALSLVVPGWAAALIVSGVLILLIGVLVIIGVVCFRRGATPLESVESIRSDLHALKGVGAYDSRR